MNTQNLPPMYRPAVLGLIAWVKEQARREGRLSPRDILPAVHVLRLVEAAKFCDDIGATFNVHEIAAVIGEKKTARYGGDIAYLLPPLIREGYRGTDKEEPAAPPPVPAPRKLDPERLAAVLITGHLAALNAGTANPEDGGTCNTDRLMIRLDKWTPDMIEATNRNTPPGVAVGPRWTSGLYKGFRPVNIGQKGQGNRRTRMVEAAHRAIRDAAPDLAHLFTVDYCTD